MKRRGAKQKLQQALRVTAGWVRRKGATDEMCEARQVASNLLKSMSGATGKPAYQPAVGTPGDEIEDGLATQISAAVAELKRLDIEHRGNVGMTGSALCRLRKEAGLTQEELGRLISMEQNHVSEMETGARPITRRTELAVRHVLTGKAGGKA